MKSIIKAKNGSLVVDRFKLFSQAKVQLLITKMANRNAKL